MVRKKGSTGETEIGEQSMAGLGRDSCRGMEMCSQKLRKDAVRARRLAEWAVNDTLRQELLQIAAEFEQAVEDQSSGRRSRRHRAAQ